jgi:hypothetical protein
MQSSVFELETGPGIVFSALVPSVDRYNGRGGRVLPLCRDPAGIFLNLALGLLDLLPLRISREVSAQDLFASIATAAVWGPLTPSLPMNWAIVTTEAMIAWKDRGDGVVFRIYRPAARHGNPVLLTRTSPGQAMKSGTGFGHGAAHHDPRSMITTQRILGARRMLVCRGTCHTQMRR